MRSFALRNRHERPSSQNCPREKLAVGFFSLGLGLRLKDNISVNFQAWRIIPGGTGLRGGSLLCFPLWLRPHTFPRLCLRPHTRPFAKRTPPFLLSHFKFLISKSHFSLLTSHFILGDRSAGRIALLLSAVSETAYLSPAVPETAYLSRAATDLARLLHGLYLTVPVGVRSGTGHGAFREFGLKLFFADTR